MLHFPGRDDDDDDVIIAGTAAAFAALALLSSGLLQGGDLGQFRGGVTSRKRTPPPLPLPPVQQCTVLGSNGENRLRDRASCAWYALAAGARSRNLVFKF